MVKLRQNTNILRSRIEMLSKCPKRRQREKEKTGAKPASSPVAPHSMSIKKCVVKIKRLSNVKFIIKSRVSNLNDAPEGSNLGDDMFHPDHLRNSTMIFQTKGKDPIGKKDAMSITPCRVRIERMPFSKMKQPEAITNPTRRNQEEHRFFHRDQPPTRTRSSVTRNVYEFLSQSQIEDVEDRHDPAEDIIKKMVRDGRACIMTRSRKPGHFRAKPVRKRLRHMGKRRQCSIDEVPVAAEPPVKKHRDNSPNYELQADFIHQDKLPLVPSHPAKLHQAMTPIYELEADSSDEDDQDNIEPIQVTAQIHAPTMESSTAATSLKSVHEPSAYSHLARSVLLNQTQNQNSLLCTARRREQLDMVRQYISTPLNGKGVKAVTTTISPISSLATRFVSSPAASSPWRVSPESPLPETFRFGFNTSNLPSFSSDHQRTRHVYVPDDNPQPPPLDNICPTMEEEYTCLESQNENHSNEENMPPSATADQENVENLLHLSNPRRTLLNRKPLKDINILEVVHLQPWKKKQLAHTTPTKDASAVLFDNDELPSQRQSPNTSRDRSESRNLFGFEEFLDPNEQLHNEAQLKARALSQNQTLNDKLHRMKRLRPSDKELPQPDPVPMRYIYIETDGCQPKQPSIKQMLCSTMIAPAIHTSSLDVDESVDLFAENQCDPEASFDHKKPRRTYVKERPKRKRKQRVKILFIDTDSSDDEQDSLEKSASPHKAPTKRPRKDPEHEAKLREFVTSFNKQCDEVEKFPLVIE